MKDITKEYKKLDMKQRLELLMELEMVAAKLLRVRVGNIQANWTGEEIIIKGIND